MSGGGPSKDTDKKKGVSYFVGGGPSSGQQVDAPADSSSVKGMIDSLFRSAPVAASDGRSTAPQAFYGYGRRLGHTQANSPFISPTALQERTVNVRVYRDGYTIDDGPLLSMDSPESVEFFESVREGIVPARLTAMYPITKISLRLIDCMHLDCKSDVRFPGTGRRLDEGTSGGASKAEVNAEMGAVALPVDARPFEFHEGEEQAKIAIVNLFGERKEFKVNPKRHTVADVYGLAAAYANVHLGAFKLVVRDVPPRQLSDESKTVDEARLSNCTVIVRTL
ncbi:hypothetical protein, conserved [Trypanosoma brucei brucei TREU927]|uniref:SEP domain-containing protein n=1 Tax=Trypanosoma brucei brucei (strain 927/4 GUTat10.1) TaxID=185431 RepID=Q57XP8_TRYB2|nr:hypothetical protein, conserved [Trypanosoma brucei brucei TREU927]AAX69621.1 hypothetical protein, conserved [Trypanosoma brucei]AAZ12290.1 hypothetical protein, conserved [Trypanosoma brucei brucei TREU927]